MSRILRNKYIKGYKEEFTGLELHDEYSAIKANIKKYGKITSDDLDAYKHLIANKALIEKQLGYYSITYKNGERVKEQIR